MVGYHPPLSRTGSQFREGLVAFISQKANCVNNKPLSESLGEKAVSKTANPGSIPGSGAPAWRKRG